MFCVLNAHKPLEYVVRGDRAWPRPIHTEPASACSVRSQPACRGPERPSVVTGAPRRHPSLWSTDSVGPAVSAGGRSCASGCGCVTRATSFVLLVPSPVQARRRGRPSPGAGPLCASPCPRPQCPGVALLGLVLRARGTRRDGCGVGQALRSLSARVVLLIVTGRPLGSQPWVMVGVGNDRIPGVGGLPREPWAAVSQRVCRHGDVEASSPQRTRASRGEGDREGPRWVLRAQGPWEL